MKQGIDGITSTENASVVKFDGPSPELSADEQLRWVIEHHLKLSAELAAHGRNIKAERHRLERTIEDYAATMREEARKAAYSGVRRQAGGLLLVTVGVLVAAVPTYR